MELTREIARRFNFLYGEFFPVPELLLTEVPKLLGIDGRKMSKSYNNSVFLSDSLEEVRRKLSQMVTDPQRARRHDPGDPEVCVLFPFHKIYSLPETIAEINRECRKAGIGCVDCKKRLIERVIEALEPVRAKREYLTQNTDEVRQILEAGNRKSRAFAEQTMAGVRELIGF